MPEGPSIVILKEATTEFVGKKITHTEGNTKQDKERLLGSTIQSIRSWGKHFLIELSGFSLRIHFLMFGSYRINERKETAARLIIQCADKSEISFYACSIKYLEGDLDTHYDWSADVMSDEWDSAAARKKLRLNKHLLVCDALLDQNIFAGVGNIIKNEVLFRIRVYPLSTLENLPVAKRRALIEQARVYSFEFLTWKKAFVLREHWLVHNKGTCPRCNIPLIRAHLGKSHRRSFYCENCQKRYG